MTVSFSDLKQQALDSLRGNWGLVIGTYVLYFLVQGASQMVYVGFLIIGGPMSLGLAIFNLNVARNRHPELSQIFEGFRNFGNALVAYLLMVLYILLWSLLFIIPGIIVSFSYSMTFYILADDPGLKPGEALQKSKAMMDGHKMDFFLLNLSFIGWALLCLLTLGIGFLWLIPYIQITTAKFYEEVKQEYYGAYVHDELDEIGKPTDPDIN